MPLALSRLPHTALPLAALCACGPPAVEAPRARAAPAPLGFAAPAPGGGVGVAPRMPGGALVAEEPAAAPPLGAIAEPPSSPPSACNEQPPQPFLIRGTYAFQRDATPEERARRKLLHRATIEYRTREYGHVEGFGDPAWNPLEPRHYAEVTTFFGIKVQLNARVIVALGCVERAIEESCSASPYAPKVLDGLRARNTFHDGEVSNHTYGIAIDINPNENSCCGCVPPLSEWPRCKEPAASPYERSRIPRCWIDAFERFGFYWLGHDELEDTMHFEFLGDPDRVVRES